VVRVAVAAAPGDVQGEDIMLPAELLEDRDLTVRAHGLLSDIDPTRWRPERAPGLRAGLTDVAGRMANRRRLEPLRLALVSEVAQLPTEPEGQRGRWLAFKQRIQPAYARVAASLRAESVHVPALRPTNHARSLFHVASAAVALTAIVLASPAVLQGIAFTFCGLAWTMELARRLDGRINTFLMGCFGKVAHPHEHQRVNSATWYATALVLLALTGSPLLAALAVVVLGVGDPVAGYVGRRYGRVKLVNGRSLEGSLAFLGSALAAALATTWGLGWGRHLSLAQGVGAAAAASLAGAVAELISHRMDDNFTIPVSAAAGAALALALLA
jgi:dolichol kinase